MHPKVSNRFDRGFAGNPQKYGKGQVTKSGARNRECCDHQIDAIWISAISVRRELVEQVLA